MLVSLEDEILEKYPEVQIGYLVAQVSVKKSDPYVENLKQSLSKQLQGEKIDATTFVTHPNISQWRKIYEQDFKVKAKTYRSSIEALLRRVVTGKEMWNICNVVDLYNCCSILSLLPMGGYDLKKVSGSIKIRFAREGEIFRALGDREKINASPNHVVYADDQRLMCWLWNHKDSEETCIDEQSEYVIFFIDAFDHNQVKASLKLLKQHLQNIQCNSLEEGVLNNTSPKVHLKMGIAF